MANNNEPTVTSPEARAEFREQILDFATRWLDLPVPLGDATGLGRWSAEASNMVRRLVHELDIAHHQLGGL